MKQNSSVTFYLYT